ncbi:hypothetical protein [Cupriavidus pinatubonensis]|uniref:hypothetical protein n=1 Tax=Cupriavidus pinatubonensis TaxID=248026 RepID=UPI00361406A1
MIISPPFLPQNGLTSTDPAKDDPMMDAVDQFELGHHGVYPIAFDRRWHCGTHLAPTEQTERVRAIADGEVIAYRVSQKAISDGQTKRDGSPDLNSNNGFVLLKHKTETGEGRTITFYSLYMHLLDINNQQRIAPQPTNPPAVGTSSALPAWLLSPTDGVQAGGGKKVYRKDMLGYWGHCHGQPHLHFEIFMTEEDFRAWFSQAGHTVQLGEKNLTTPVSKDYWGHSYFVIPGGEAIVSVPPGQDRSPYFPPLRAGALGAQNKLYVEAYFHKGQRYTRSWIEKDGKLEALTAAPVRDPYVDYEYKLYQRATNLYPKCPSAGYELLRFGRVLNTELPTLSLAESRTWIAVTYDATGAQGYIDVSQDAIKKLSDADFPFFMGWQKIEEANTPFSQDGLCDFDELRKIVDLVEESETPEQRREAEYKQEDQLTAYVYGNDAVRRQLRGFVCHAPSEWDASGNDARYARLNSPDGFFGKRKNFDPHGYEDFIRFLRQLQFLEQTPLGAGRKFWFFHPLAFIRHFRKCGWIGSHEISQIMPAKSWLTQSGQRRTPLSKLLSASDVITRVTPHLSSLNVAIRKYSIGFPADRLALFLAQTYIETDRWNTLREYGKGASNPSIPMAQYYEAFYGRGIMQLTWAENYDAYGKFTALPNNQGPYEGESRITQSSVHYWSDPTIRDKKTYQIIGIKGVPKIWAPFYNPELIAKSSSYACDSGGFFWVWKHYDGSRNINRVADSGFTGSGVDKINKLVNGGSFGYFERFLFSWYTRNIFTDWIPSSNELSLETPRQVAVVCDLTKPK